VVGFNPLETTREWFLIRHVKITERNKSDFLKKQDLEDYTFGLKFDLPELTSLNKNRQFHAVQFTADKLLLEKGYPTKASTQLPNIDVTDIK